MCKNYMKKTTKFQSTLYPCQSSPNFPIDFSQPQYMPNRLHYGIWQDNSKIYIKISKHQKC